MIQRQGTNQEINHNENQLAQNNQQGNYSLRRPPKLIIPQAVIEQWEKMGYCKHIDV